MRSKCGAWKARVLATSSGFPDWAGSAGVAAVLGIGGSAAVRSQAPSASAIAEESRRVRSIGWGPGVVEASQAAEDAPCAARRERCRSTCAAPAPVGLSAVGAGPAPDRLAATVDLVHGDHLAGVADPGQRRVVGLDQAAGA